MVTEDPSAKTAESDGARQKPVDLRASTRRAPTQAVPTNRIAFPKQLDLLRAYAAASGVERRPVNMADAAKMVGLVQATASLPNSFFLDAGFLARADNAFVPTDAVVAYHQAYGWNPDTAVEKLAPALRGTWGWRTLEGRLRFGPLPDHEAVRQLAEASNASKEYEPQLRLILTFFEAAGMISRDGNMLRLVRDAGTAQRELEVDREPPADPPADGRPRGGAGGSGTPPTISTVHPALVGLLQLLPPPLTPWRKGKQAWLEAFTSAINAVYPDDGEEGDA